MGSSTKRKKEKKKDFQKAKLKVGKTKAKADNFTDTSFKAKSLVLSKQSISLADSAPSAASQFARHISLLRHRSETQRQESLAYLTTTILSLPPGEAPPEPVATLLPKLQPLLLDGNTGVRQQLLKLLRCLPQDEVRTHAEQILLYTRAAMTHMSADIRLFSIDILDWLVAAAKNEVVSCPGAWIKTLRCLLGLLGWQEQATQHGGWSAMQKPVSKPGSETKATARFALGLATYIKAGVSAPKLDTLEPQESWPLWYVPQNTLPQRSTAFAHLNLFGSPDDLENAMLEDREDRQRSFALSFEPLVSLGVEDMKRQGGELGRASAAIRRAIQDGMADYERDD